MKQAIAILLKPKKKLEKIRNTYNRDKTKPHITLVYSFANISQKSLENHIKESIKKIKPFKIVLGGLKKSAKEYYLYFLVKNGRNNVITLCRNLNSGILKKFKNPKMPKYIPHITLGIFKNKKELNKAIKTLKTKKLKFGYKISSIQLLTLNQDYSIKKTKNFTLK